jgi:hypothetical protein
MNPKLIPIYFTSMAVYQNWITSTDCRNKNVFDIWATSANSSPASTACKQEQRALIV